MVEHPAYIRLAGGSSPSWRTIINRVSGTRLHIPSRNAQKLVPSVAVGERRPGQAADTKKRVTGFTYLRFTGFIARWCSGLASGSHNPLTRVRIPPAQLRFLLLSPPVIESNQAQMARQNSLSAKAKDASSNAVREISDRKDPNADALAMLTQPVSMPKLVKCRHSCQQADDMAV